MTPLLCLLTAAAAAVRAEDHADLPPSAEVDAELYATGMEAVALALDREGNLFTANYRVLGTIGRVTPDGTAGVLVDLVDNAAENATSQAVGIRVNGQGRLVVADAVGGRLLRVDADGRQVSVLADRYEGRRFAALRNVALDLAGNVYFTDAGDGGAQGTVFRFDVVTRRVSLQADGLEEPAGVAVAPDQRQLCLAEAARRRILLFDLDEDGSLANRRTLIEFPERDDPPGDRGPCEPLGMVFDACGRLFVAMGPAGYVQVVEVPSGRLLRRYDAGGEPVTDCHFHDGYLYTALAAKEAVFRLPLGVAGFEYSRSAATPD